MHSDDQKLYQIFITNPDHVAIDSDLYFELNHSENYNCVGSDVCESCRFKNVESCAISQKGHPELCRALTEYFSEHYPEKLI